MWAQNYSENYILLLANQTIQDASVQYILDTVVAELQQDKNKHFIYVEVAFFARWWNEQTKDMKQDVRELVNQGDRGEYPICRHGILGHVWVFKNIIITLYTYQYFFVLKLIP